MMKSNNFSGIRGTQVFLTLTMIICTTVLIWAWDKTPLVGNLKISWQQYNVRSAEAPIGSYLKDRKQHQNKENVLSNSTIVHFGNEKTDQVPDADLFNTIPSGNEQSDQVPGVVDVSNTTAVSSGNEQSDQVPGVVDVSNTTAVSSGNEQTDQVPGADLSNTTIILSGNVQGDQLPGADIPNATVVLPINEKADQVPEIPPVSSSVEENTVENNKSYDDTNSAQEVKKECDYGKGRWVPDDKHPLYSGFHCKQWLSEMWACRLMQRTDVFYENFKWQPDNCEIPDFESLGFFNRMKDQTIALVGDSLGRQQFQSMMCIVTGGRFSPEVQNVGKEYGLLKARGAIRPDGWVYRFPSTNTTILYYWSATLCELEPLNMSNPKTNFALHLDRPAKFLQHYIHKFDVLVLNTGHHWNRGKMTANQWEMYAGGKPINDRSKLSIISNARNFAVYNVAKWVDSQIPNHPGLKTFFRTLSPRHFLNGDWNSGGSCNNTIPLISGNRVSNNVSIDAPAENAVKGTKVKLLDITALSQLRDEGHISKYSIRAFTGIHDCLHWCLPGIPDAWNEVLFAQI